jgi:demethylmenaquinone methyltransferase / 2-methoxy-6-polyprenyl-1,4-benzoquinol methylase
MNAPSPEPAWTPAELAANPHRHAGKPEKVRGMFAAIAGKYDLNNRVHSLGRDQAWRREAVRQAGVRPTDRVLDVACGTGDLTRAMADAGAAEVVGLDFTPEMLAVARRKRLAPATAPDGKATIRYIDGDAMNLPFEDAGFDVLSTAFGIRNVADPARALREFRRVLRPGGRLVILEFGTPPLAPVRWMNKLYTGVIMPRTATLISGDKSGAYHYLPRSVETFMERDTMAQAMRDAGFASCTYKPMTLGVCLCYRGEVASS